MCILIYIYESLGWFAGKSTANQGVLNYFYLWVVQATTSPSSNSGIWKMLQGFQCWVHVQPNRLDVNHCP